MDHDNNLSNLNGRHQLKTFQEKVYIIADEVLGILKELHHEHKELINSSIIAEKMFTKESVKKVLVDYSAKESEREKKVDPLKETVDRFFNMLSDLVPSFVIEDINNLEGQYQGKAVHESSSDWMDSAIKSVKKYVDSVSNRVNELEDVLKKTTDCLTDTEKRLASELSSAQGKFKEDRDFEKNISSNMSGMRQSFNISGDIDSIKAVVFSKIENINKVMEKKKEQDVLRLKETENALQEMSRKMSDIKNEAEAIKKRAQEVEHESFCDALTGLYNRKAYDLKVEETLAILDRYDFPSALLVCDIDHFKTINDTFGHHIGDLTIKKVAEFFKERLRKNDFIARYGGEEYVGILSYTSLEEAKKVSEDMRCFIDHTDFTFKGRQVPVTISIGISVFKKGDDATTVFERADEALYLAKDSGRNMVKTENDVKESRK